MMKLAQNQVIKFPLKKTGFRLHRVLWINPKADQVVGIDLERDSELKRPIVQSYTQLNAELAAGKSQIVEFQLPKYMLSPEESLNPRDKQMRDKNWKIVEELVSRENEPGIYDPTIRSVLIRDAIAKHRKKQKSILRLLYRYWKYGKIKNAFLSAYSRCGAPGLRREPGDKKRGRPRKAVVTGHDPKSIGINVDESVRRTMLMAIDAFWGDHAKPSYRKAYKTMLARFFCRKGHKEDGSKVTGRLLPANKRPTFEQFYYVAKRHVLNPDFREKHVGSRQWNLSDRELVGTARSNVDGPGEVFEIDSTIADIYLVSRLNRNWVIGRPVIYVVIDVYTRLIVGLHVGLVGPSWEGARLALMNAFSPKMDFCARHGRIITPDQWAAQHLPFRLQADRAELLGPIADALQNSLGITTSILPGCRADWKAVVERRFRIINDTTVNWLPGAVIARQKERMGRDYRLDATLNMQEFTRIMINCVLEHNLYTRYPHLLTEDMIADGVEPTPAKMWEWGLKNLTGSLNTQPPNLVRAHLLPSDEAKVTAGGIKWKGMYFTCDVANDERWYARARHEGEWSVPIRHDSWPNKILMGPLKDGSLIECQRRKDDLRFEEKRLEEVVDFLEYQSMTEAQAEDEALQPKLDLNADTEATIDKAKKQLAEQLDKGLSKTKKIRDSAVHRENEKALERVMNQRAAAPPGTPALSVVKKKPNTAQAANDGDSMLDLLRAERDAALNALPPAKNG